MLPNPTLDQLQVFLAVADAGSFSSAARIMNRAQSVISYTIGNLEEQLQVSLFDRSGSRQPVLTDAGKAILTDARRIVGDLQVLRARAAGMQQGLEAEVSVAISVMVPTMAMVAVLKEFRDMFPSVSLRLDVGELGKVMELVMLGRSSLGIGGALVRQDDSLIIERIGHNFMLPVAAADHPLARIGRPLTLADVREEVQLVVTDATELTAGRDFNVLSYHTWRVSDIPTKHHLIRGGLGWGGLPASTVDEDLVSGRLVKLDLEAYENSSYSLYAIRRRANPPGPAGTWLVDAFRARLSNCPSDYPQEGFQELLKKKAVTDSFDSLFSDQQPRAIAGVHPPDPADFRP